jgi:hypothetical protein
MAKMKKEEIAVKFAALSDVAKAKNIENKDKRFLPMSHTRHHKLQEFGLYDYKTKRYTLGSIHSGKAQTILKEMREMLNK